MQATVPLFARADFRALAGPALRPGGTALTARGLDACALRRGARVADVGCGRGASLELLEERGLRAVGLDMSGDLLAEASRAFPLLRARGEELPLATASLHCVLCECVLSLSVAPDAFLSELARVLVPDGRLLLSDLYRRDTSLATESAAGCASGAVTRDILEQRLAQAGFTLLLFEDHTRLLAELTGRLLFAGLPRGALGLGCVGSSKPGYFLCVAQRT